MYVYTHIYMCIYVYIHEFVARAGAGPSPSPGRGPPREGGGMGGLLEHLVGVVPKVFPEILRGCEKGDPLTQNGKKAMFRQLSGNEMAPAGARPRAILSTLRAPGRTAPRRRS